MESEVSTIGLLASYHFATSTALFAIVTHTWPLLTITICCPFTILPADPLYAPQMLLFHHSLSADCRMHLKCHFPFAAG